MSANSAARKWKKMMAREDDPADLSPLQDRETFCYKIYLNKRQAVEDYMAHDMNVPTELIDAMNEWHDRWKAQVRKNMAQQERRLSPAVFEAGFQKILQDMLR